MDNFDQSDHHYGADTLTIDYQYEGQSVSAPFWPKLTCSDGAGGSIYWAFWGPGCQERNASGFVCTVLSLTPPQDHHHQDHYHQDHYHDDHVDHPHVIGRQ